MNKSQVLESNSLKRRFVKDANLPISVTDNPYFMQRLELVDTLRNDSFASKAFDDFCEMLKNFDNEQDYFRYYRQMKESMMEDIKSSGGYKDFCSSTFAMTLDLSEEKYKFSKADLYKEYNDGHLFVSIDMRKANFSALKFYDSRNENKSKMFGDAETWEEFIGHYTSYKALINSKYIREVVLGNCNPKRQIQLENFMMQRLANYLQRAIPNLEIYSVHNDEILIDVMENKKNGVEFSKDYLTDIIQRDQSKIGILTKIEIFQLNKILNGDGWYQNIYNDNGETRFKCVDSDLFPQYVKTFFGMNVTEDDLVFRHNGKLARFLEGVDDPWER